MVEKSPGVDQLFIFNPAIPRVLYGSTAKPPTPTLLVLTFAGIAATALNGITEAFFHATARKTALAQANNVTLVFSVGYILLYIAFATVWGAPGVVAANAVMMTVRTAYNVRQIVEQHGALDIPAILPPPTAVAAVAVAFVGNVVFVSQTHLRSVLCLALGVLSGALCWRCCLCLTGRCSITSSQCSTNQSDSFHGPFPARLTVFLCMVKVSENRPIQRGTMRCFEKNGTHALQAVMFTHPK